MKLEDIEMDKLKMYKLFRIYHKTGNKGTWNSQVLIKYFWKTNPASWKQTFSNFFCMFLNPQKISNLNSNCSNLLDLRNLQEQFKNAFCYQNFFWPFTDRTNCLSDLKIFVNSQHSASNFKTFSWSLEQIFSHSRSEQFW